MILNQREFYIFKASKNRKEADREMERKDSVKFVIKSSIPGNLQQVLV